MLHLRIGLKVSPSDWSKKELLEKLVKFGGKFVQGKELECLFITRQLRISIAQCFFLDKKTGICDLQVDGHMLLGDDVDVILEFCRRFSEIQSISLTRCGLTDITFVPLVENGFTQLRHLKQLDIGRNLLKNDTVRVLIKTFAQKLSDPIETIDTRGNALSFEDGL